ncbi:hypothetical protein PAXRUDRAFT_829806 [Paxillus rubicundulus Ve08.2h10]|uniref:Uncharacterized protein n=1 Tax=Paxillus rubicundulus Ve08.2h10 TaxID=930991 RepID=A0A0D0DUC9_9AGAM|nr:hypothetical protein PAXRUDRAFT_829806 [Paxillus rubicundulus Ve08.2h10]
MLPRTITNFTIKLTPLLSQPAATRTSPVTVLHGFSQVTCSFPLVTPLVSEFVVPISATKIGVACGHCAAYYDPLLRKSLSSSDEAEASYR